MKVEEGDLGPHWRYGPLTREDFVRYAGASYDFIPLHYDDAYARAAGYATIFAQGLFSAGLLGSYLTRWFHPESVRRFRVRFRDLVWPGDTLLAEGRVVRLWQPAGGARCADLEVALRRQDGAAAVTGAATVVVPD